MSIGRITLLVAVSLVAPGVLLAEALTGDVTHGTMIALSSALLFLIVLTRLAGVVSRHRQAVERERTLRSAGADLVSAADATAVAASLRAAVGRLVPANAPHRAVLLIDGESAGVPGPGPAPRTRRAGSCNVETLDGAAAREMEGFATALVVPARADGPAHRRVVRGAPRRRRRRDGSAHPPRCSGGARVAGRARGRAGDAEPGGDPAQQRGVLPDARAERPRRHPDRRRRRPHPVRQPVGGDAARPGLDGGEASRRSRRRDATPPSGRCRSVWAGEARPGTRSYQILRTDGKRVDVEVVSRDLRRRSHRPRGRAHHAGRHRTAEAGGRAHPPGQPRLAHRAREPGPVPRPGGARTRAPTTAGSWGSSWSTSTTSSSSTTRWGTARATSCWSPSPDASPPSCAPTTSRRGSVATSSRSSSRAPRTPPRSRRSRRGSSTPSPPPSTSSAG